MDIKLFQQLVELPRSSWEIVYPAYSSDYFLFCDEFSHYVAMCYLSGTLSFEAADRAMNELFSYSYSDEDRGMPDFALQVFNAFDQGEFHHRDDSHDVDPEQKYTRPILIKVFEQHSLVANPSFKRDT